MALAFAGASSKAVVTRRSRSLATPIRVPAARPQSSITRPQVQVNFFKFGGAPNPNLEGKPGNGRNFYRIADVDDYWNNQGFLAVEGGYDRMEALLQKHHPCDVMLLLAAQDNDAAKIEEVLKAGADIRVTDLEGKTALQLATKSHAIKALQEADAKAKSAV